MTTIRSTIGILTVLVAAAGCSSSSTGPKPGSWQVTVSGMTHTFTPTSFTLTFTTVAGTQQVAPLPAMTYNGVALDAVGSARFGVPSKDSVMTFGQLVQLVGDTLVGLREGTGGLGCNIAFVNVAFNAARDSMSGVVWMLDGSAGFSTCDQATFAAVKR